MLQNFKLAKLHKTKNEIYIDYYINGHRKKIKLNKYNKKDVDKIAKIMIQEINNKLINGYVEKTNNKYIINDLILLYKEKIKKLRPDTIKFYNLKLKLLLNFIDIKKIKYLDDFDFTMAGTFIDWVKVKYNWGAIHYNRGLLFYKTLWNFFIEYNYTNENVFKKFKKEKEPQKQRQIIPDDLLNKIFNFVEKDNKWCLLYFYLIFYCFIRPREITFLKPEHFDIDKKIILIPYFISKNNKSQYVTITNKLLQLLNELNFNEIPKEYYIFSFKNKPGQQNRDARYLAKYWARIRKKINFNKEYQLYSLKDTGIIKMIKAGIDPISVRDQARHYSLEVTNKYIILAKDQANKDILNKINY